MVGLSLSKRAGKVVGDIMTDLGRKKPGSGKFSLRLFGRGTTLGHDPCCCCFHFRCFLFFRR